MSSLQFKWDGQLKMTLIYLHFAWDERKTWISLVTFPSHVVVWRSFSVLSLIGILGFSAISSGWKLKVIPKARPDVHSWLLMHSFCQLSHRSTKIQGVDSSYQKNHILNPYVVVPQEKMMGKQKRRCHPWDKESQGGFPEVKIEVLYLSKVPQEGTKHCTPLHPIQLPDISVYSKLSSAWLDLRYYSHYFEI